MYSSTALQYHWLRWTMAMTVKHQPSLSCAVLLPCVSSLTPASEALPSPALTSTCQHPNADQPTYYHINHWQHALDWLPLEPDIPHPTHTCMFQGKITLSTVQRTMTANAYLQLPRQTTQGDNSQKASSRRHYIQPEPWLLSQLHSITGLGQCQSTPLAEHVCN